MDIKITNSVPEKSNFITAHYYDALQSYESVGFYDKDSVSKVKPYNCVGVFNIKYK